MTMDKKIWSRDDVFDLIALYQNNPPLWDVRHKDFNNRPIKAAALEAIAEHFDTTGDQVLKKVHNLRSQLAQELKKQATRKSKDGITPGYISRWPYYKVLSFLIPEANTTNMCLEMASDANIEVDLRPPESYEQSIEDYSCASDGATGPSFLSKKRSAEDTPTSEEVLLKAIKVLTDQEDEYQVFGRYIAGELRGLYSEDSRRQLKRAIQRAVLEVAEMDDMLRINSHSDPLSIGNPTHPSTSSMQ